MATLTDVILERLRADLADNGEAVAFEDHELRDLYDSTNGDYWRTVEVAIVRLMMNAVKMAVWRQNNQDKLEGKEVFERLKQMLEVVKMQIDETRSQVARASVIGKKTYRYNPLDRDMNRRRRRGRR